MRNFGGMLPAWSVLALSLCGTGAGWYLTQSAAEREASSRFQAEIAAVEVDLTERLLAYEQVLRGGVSLFYSWPRVTRENWRNFVGHLHIVENYPGIQGIGFAQVVSPADREAHELRVRALGFSDYQIWPEGERAVYTSIIYLEPFDWRNQRAFGYDMLQEPVRRAAMEQARDSGSASLSGKVTLVQETDEAVQAGFLIYLPVYSTPSPSQVEDRRRHLIGYVYSPFRMGDFMSGLLGDRQRQVSLQIFDGDTLAADTLMYSSSSHDPAKAAKAQFVAMSSLDWRGHTWTLRFASLPGLNIDRSAPLIVLGGGLVASILLWAIVWSLARNRWMAAAANERLQSDVARLERTEARLRDAESSFRYLFEKNPNPMWVFDSESLAILEVNDAATVHFGYSKDELRHMLITELRPPEDIPLLKSYRQNRPPGLKSAGEWRHLTKDGRQIDVDVASFTLKFRKRECVLVVARDITESKRAAEALRESEAVARGVLDSALDAYVRMDEDGRITEWNAMAESAFGWPRDEILGRPLETLLIPPEQREAHRQGTARFLATGESRLLNRRVELQALHRSGKRFPVELTVQAVETGRGRYFSAFARDLSEKRKAEAQLHQAQKMEAVGHLTGGIAHDFNNLLTALIGNLEIAREKQHGHAAEYIDQALDAAEKGAALTHRLLAFSRQQPLQPTPTDLNDLVGGMIDLLRRTLGEHIEVQVRMGKDLWSQLADKSQVENALLNLAINSRDAMPDGGKLTIETGNVSFDAEYAALHEEVEPGDYVMLAVTDTGIGMPSEVVDQAFEPFFTTKEAGKGSGLGLSMIYGFAKQSGGHLKIYSEVDHGTSVKLYLPRAKDAEPKKAIETTPTTELRGSETILVVEDEAAVRKLVVTILGRMGYRILEAPEALQALEILRGDEPIDLLFTDIVMPGGMTGRQLAEEGRTLRPEMRVLFTSGYTQNSIVHQGKLDAGVQLLSKPYRREDLARKVREVLQAGRAG